MPIRLSSLMADRRTVRVPFGDDTLTLTYRPSAVNATQEARELEQRAKGEHLKAQANSLAEIITEWDVLGEDGKPVAPTTEVIGWLGLEVTTRLMRAILADLLPNVTTGDSSPNGSAAAAS